MRIWPFKPRNPLSESLEWSTDVFRAKSSEQRIALRKNPRRVFQMTHFMRDKDANYARSLIRNFQADESGSFLIPDWTQSSDVGAVSPGSGVVISADLTDVFYGEKAILWQSEYLNEAVDVTWDSNGLTCDVIGTYTNAKIMPAFAGESPDGLEITRTPASVNNVTIGFVLSDDYDIGSSNYSQYRGLDVISDCPIVGSGSFSESLAYQLSTFDTASGDNEYIRYRTYAENSFQMRWHKFTREDIFDLRQWISSRRGRQKAFWISSHAQDYEVASISGTTVTVFNEIVSRSAEFDIEIVDSGDVYYRNVESLAAGPTVDGRQTVEMTIDTSVPITTASRISNLMCARFNADRIDFNHGGKAGTIVQVPCLEVPIP